jgi:hypothetical protein
MMVIIEKLGKLMQVIFLLQPLYSYWNSPNTQMTDAWGMGNFINKQWQSFDNEKRMMEA